MQYILTQEELDTLPRDKATRMLVEFIQATRPIVIAESRDQTHGTYDEPTRMRLVERTTKQLAKIAERYGANIADVERVWDEITSQTTPPQSEGPQQRAVDTSA